MTDRSVNWSSVLLNVFPLCPAFKVESGRGRPVGKIAKHISTKARLDFNGSLQVQLFGPRFGSFVPFLEDLGDGGFVDLDELLEFVQVVVELLEAFDQGCEAG